VLLAGFVGAAACGGPSAAARGGGEEGCNATEARRVVEMLGERMKQVSLLAPAYEVAAEIRKNYSDLVTPNLLDQWLFQPTAAPGREVSSPWPDRIEIDTVLPADGQACLVRGKIVYLTSEEVTHGGAAALQPVSMRVERQDGDGWRIASYQVTTPPGTGPADAGGATTPPSLDSTSAAAAADVIRRYYAAIDAREFRRAYEMWGDGGKDSGLTFEEFAAGFAETAQVEVEVGEPGRVEGAAGSRYVEVPVVIRAVLASGERQRFTGSYTLQRVVVEGAAPAERRWHLYSAKIVRTN
jgi:hypothetical protein